MVVIFIVKKNCNAVKMMLIAEVSKVKKKMVSKTGLT